MGDLFDPQKLFQVPFQEDILGPFSIVYLVVFVAGFAASAWLYWRPPARVRAHDLRRRLSRRFAQLLLWAFGIGLVFFGFRVLGLPGLGWRLWAYVTALGVLGVIVYIAYYVRTRYPRELAAYEARQLKRQYLQASRRRVADDGQPLPRSPRAEKRRQRSRGARTRSR